MMYLSQDVSALSQTSSAQRVVDPHRLLIQLQLQVGVGEEDVLAPVVRQLPLQLRQLVSVGHETRELQPGSPVRWTLLDTATNQM